MTEVQVRRGRVQAQLDAQRFSIFFGAQQLLHQFRLNEQLFGAALAASLLVAVMLGQHVSEQRAQLAELRAEQEGMEASRELMQALRLTSEKLDIAYQAVQGAPRADAEENRS